MSRLTFRLISTLSILVSQLLLTNLAAIAPEPLQNHCPVVVVNNTTLSADEVYFVSNGLDNDSTPCFFVPDSLGVCPYVYPQPDGSSGSASSSRKLSELPLATDTGISGDAYLIYLPINVSTRAYFSIKTPMYLSTTFSRS